jgi:class 3 adenylate cyclase/DNA-binding response OmpR family regulator
MDKLRVLVVDDSQDIREFVAEYILQPNGYAVEVARDGAEGLRKALAGRPDLILVDYEMPKLNGLDLLRELRKSNQTAPVIMMTSYGSEQVAVEGFRLGVRDYIIKPFKPEEMLNVIQNVLLVTRLQQEKETLTRQVMEINQQLEQYVHELNTLAQIGKSITALMSPTKMLERIVDTVLFMTQSEECTLALVNPETGQLREPLRRRRQAQRRTTGSLNPAQADDPDSLSPSARESTLSLPLRLGERVVGHLRICKAVGERFNWHDERILGMLADYAAIAIHNMQLIRQLQLTKEREKQQIRALFERYVAPRVVEQMLTQPEKVSLGGTRQMVAVLFADLRGFSAFSARMSPEMLVELLNQYIRVAADAVLAEEGTLDKFMGDAVMAFFNAPLTQSDFPLRAVRAAWKLCRQVEQLHQDLDPAFQLQFGVGVGIGEAIVGNIGTPQMMNFTIVGDAVNKAKRLQENAHGGQILIGQETYRLVRYEVQARYVGQVQLKGQVQPEPVYELLSLR